MVRKPKVSHEVPLCLLEDSLKFNDYQYCLPHLLDEEPGYEEHFRKYKADGGYIIMDNSLHELGEAYNAERLIYWINELEPDEFIVPDVWEDYRSSVQNAKIWLLYRFPINTTKVAVVQATSLYEASECYKAYKELGYEKIAFSYGAAYFNDVVPHPNKDLGKALGRMVMISALYKTSVIKDGDRVHLLGCAVPQEFGWYQGYDFIESIDTSNPVMAALEKTWYTSAGLDKKPKANMNDYFYMSGDQIEFTILSNNLRRFREINNL